MRGKIDLQKYLMAFKFHFAESPEVQRVIQTHRTGDSCSSVPAWRLGLC